MQLLSHPLFGVLLTLVSFEIGKRLYRATGIALFNPMLIAVVLIVAVLVVFDIPIDAYQQGGDVLSFFLGPLTVALAFPLYKQLDLLKDNLVPIVIGVVVGVVTVVVSVLVLGKLMGLEDVLLLSMAAKSITTPIGIELSQSIGGVQALTILGIVVTGITGAILAPFICKVFKIENRVARGIAIGLSSHATGTAKAIEMGEVEGAMSGLAISLAGLATVFILPVILKLLGRFIF